MRIWIYGILAGSGILPASTMPALARLAAPFARRFLPCCWLALLWPPLTASAAGIGSIIIDDIGNDRQAAEALLDLPVAVTLSILPNTRYARDIAEQARQRRREIMLHLPLQSIENRPDSPGTLHLHMTKPAFLRQLRQDLDAVPHISGVNNHMGSLLTRHPGHMGWLMAEIRRRSPELFFVDSRTTTQTVAERIAREYTVPAIRRDVFLDPDKRPETLQRQFERFIRLIEQRGYALAIGHPHAETIAFLQSHLGELKQLGIEIVPVSQLIRQNRDYYASCTRPAC